MAFTFRSGSRPLDGYTIKRGIGAGGFGEVYYALSDGGKEVALKLIQRHLDVELRGVRQCMNLKHPNLVTTFDVRTSSDGDHWVIMEYLEGPNLATVLDGQRGGLSKADAFAWLQGIAAAVDYLHENGIVHRDLKPANIFREGGIVKLGDYGLSKFIGSTRRGGQTESIGTVHYMAPEISGGDYGKAIDSYAMGIIAYELLCGAVPFDGQSVSEILMKHLTGAPDLSKVDPALHPVFQRALDKDPAKRFPTAGGFVRALAAASNYDLGGAGRPHDEAQRDAPVPKPARQRDDDADFVPVDEPIEVAPHRQGVWGQSLPPLPGTFAAKRRAASDLLWSMFQAGLLSAILPVLFVTLELLRTSQVPGLETYSALAATSGLASWGLLILGRIWDSRRESQGGRHLQAFLLGLVMGPATLALDLWLGRSVRGVEPMQGFALPSPDQVRDLTEPLLVYVSFFALTFAIPDWGHAVSEVRKSKFSLWRVIWPGSVAMVLAAMLGQRAGLSPVWTGGVVALTAVIVQWVTPCAPPRRRRKRVARRHARPAKQAVNA